MRTRLAKAGEFDAIVVAAVALQRLGLGEHLAEVLSADAMVPQVGQGALAAECRAGDGATLALLAAIEHGPSRRRVDAERAFLAELGGDCELPAGAHATLDGDRLHLAAVLADDAGTVHRHAADGDDPTDLGTEVARHLRDRAGLA
jgi:hydroxymethylbilane synthase